ncbi:MAG: ECF transporter S component [Lachnospiraceae bacterium]|nr:ECF transporter S component [Lachnospiraceae bacterium]MBQ9563107.1 ECF transporter S component [Lachnospiraceae bacterium]MBQ9592458.1 ECF transporter S component [Lachnospiraceae bacterium]MBR0153521.1 ECF transporter S component [Lachnospiraceae bacterium]
MKTKDITFLAIGIALFVALSMCLRVPVFENYYLCLGYVVMTAYIWCFRWYEGAVIGFLGVILYCIIGGLGFNGMPGWAVGNIVIGLILGAALKYIQRIKNKTLQVAATAVVAVAATFAGIEIVKSLIDSFVVGQPFVVRFAKNMTSFVADAFVIVISLPVCVLIEKPARSLRYR